MCCTRVTRRCRRHARRAPNGASAALGIDRPRDRIAFGQAPLVLRHAHSADLAALLLTHPLERFEPRAAVPFMLQLKRRHGDECQHFLAEAIGALGVPHLNR